MGNAQSFTDIKREVIQYMACHQSIKAGDEIWNRGESVDPFQN